MVALPKDSLLAGSTSSSSSLPLTLRLANCRPGLAESSLLQRLLLKVTLTRSEKGRHEFFVVLDKQPELAKSRHSLLQDLIPQRILQLETRSLVAMIHNGGQTEQEKGLRHAARV